MSKTRASIALLAAGSCLALAAGGPADAAKKKSCKNKKEEAGCKLPADAHYTGKLGGGPGSGGVSVEKGGWSVSVSAGDPRGQGPCDPRFSRTTIDFKGRPKVGKSYTLSQNTRRPDSGVDNRIQLTGKVTITSAKKAKFSGTFSSQRSFRTTLFAPCQRTLPATAKREQ